MSKVKMTPYQRETLVVLSKASCRMETNQISLIAGRRYTGWAYSKLQALRKNGLVLCNPGDRCSLTTWQITDLGRAALSDNRSQTKGDGV
jgi:hypothetical protein